MIIFLIEFLLAVFHLCCLLRTSQVLIAKLEKAGKHLSAEEKNKIMKVRSERLCFVMNG